MNLRLHPLLLLTVLVLLACRPISSCDQFNIDSYEYRTGVDIPPITEFFCEEQNGLRVSLFYFDTTTNYWKGRYGDFDSYLDRYAFGPYSDEPAEISFLPAGARTFDTDTTPHRSLKVSTDEPFWRLTVFPGLSLMVAEMEVPKK